MNSTNHPSKERIRAWIYNRQIEPKPLPDMERIRIELGWNLVKPDRIYIKSHGWKD
ncbi:MAG TPA: hypothetical protein VIF82_07080 [Burkholderiaceae bacterium]